MNGQIELMIVNQDSAKRKLEKWQVLSVYDSFIIYRRCGGNRKWEEFQTIIRKRNFVNDSLDKLIETPIAERDIPNVNETDVVVIPVEIRTDRPESIELSELRNDRGDEFRNDILANRNSYIYTKNYGWVDRGHAGFLGGRMTLKKLYMDILNSKVGSNITYEMTTRGGLGPIRVGNTTKIKIQILKSIQHTPLIAMQITLHILKKISFVFEENQKITDFIKQSSFAEEDLPSNIINFLFEIISRDEANIMQHCIPFSQAQSAWIYDRYIFERNRTFEPIIRYPSGKKPWIFTTIQEMEEGEYYRIMELK